MFFKKNTPIFTTMVALLSLGACGAIELSAIPITSVSTSGTVLNGEISPRADFTSMFTLAEAGTGLSCQGQTGANGQGNMSCTDGSSYEIAIPGYPSFNGSYVATYDATGALVGADEATEVVAIGYGNAADTALLRNMLQ